MDDTKHDPPPHDEAAREPLGPFTPDSETPAGTTPEVHDEITAHDIPKSNPAHREVARRAGGIDEPLEGDAADED